MVLQRHSVDVPWSESLMVVTGGVVLGGLGSVGFMNNKQACVDAGTLEQIGGLEGQA